ncbi:MAG: hypothetical protein GXN97_04150 [Aquificae bacterium]|nr:hypothetical protein [Aquificota bacterium]
MICYKETGFDTYASLDQLEMIFGPVNEKKLEEIRKKHPEAFKERLGSLYVRTDFISQLWGIKVEYNPFELRFIVPKEEVPKLPVYKSFQKSLQNWMKSRTYKFLNRSWLSFHYFQYRYSWEKGKEGTKEKFSLNLRGSLLKGRAVGNLNFKRDGGRWEFNGFSLTDEYRFKTTVVRLGYIYPSEGTPYWGINIRSRNFFLPSEGNKVNLARCLNRSDVTLIRIYINNNLYKEVKPENNGCFSVELENITPSDQIKIEYLTSDGKVEKETLEGKKLLNPKKSKNKFDYSVSFGVDTKKREPQTRIDLNFHPDGKNDFYTSFRFSKLNFEGYNIGWLHKLSKTKKIQISFNGRVLSSRLFGSLRGKKVRKYFSISVRRDLKKSTNSYGFFGSIAAKEWRINMNLTIPPPPGSRQEQITLSRLSQNLSLSADFKFEQEVFKTSSYGLGFGLPYVGNLQLRYSTDFKDYKYFSLSWNKILSTYNLGWYFTYNTNLRGNYNYSFHLWKGFSNRWFYLSVGLKYNPLSGYFYSLSINGYFYRFGNRLYFTSRSLSNCVGVYGVYKKEIFPAGIDSGDPLAKEGIICGLDTKRAKKITLIPIQHKDYTFYPDLEEIKVYQIPWEFNIVKVPYSPKVPTLIDVFIKGKSFAGLKVYIDKKIKFTDLSGEIFTYLTEGEHTFCIDPKLAKKFKVKNRCIKVKITKEDLLMGGKEILFDFN